MNGTYQIDARASEDLIHLLDAGHSPVVILVDATPRAIRPAMMMLHAAAVAVGSRMRDVAARANLGAWQSADVGSIQVDVCPHGAVRRPSCWLIDLRRQLLDKEPFPC